MKTQLYIVLFSLIICISANAAQHAFPGAEGFGRFAQGGRGGTVYHVTNLNDAGAGSFRDAVSKPNRIIVFDVGGVIRLISPLSVSSYLTIAGETAPGDGICVYGNGVAFGGSKHSIIRYIRFRMGIVGRDGGDAVGVSSGSHLIFDHVSISWGRDGTLDMNRDGTKTLDSITFQDCIISHGLQPHSTGGLMQTNGRFSVLRTLYINNWTRNPKQACNHQYVNNVVYNWGASCYNFGGGTAYNTYSNVTNNYFICGVGSTRDGIVGGDSTVFAYLKGNYFDKNRNGILDGVEFTNYSTLLHRQTTPNNYPPLKKEMTAREAYFSIIANAGASFRRDEVDKNLMLDLQSLGPKGYFITKEDTLPTKGPGVIKGGTLPTDTDKDGMPDAWEMKNGTDYKTSDAMKDNDGDGYVNIENYIHSITNPVVNGIHPQNTDKEINAYLNPETKQLQINLPESLLPCSIGLSDVSGSFIRQTSCNQPTINLDMQPCKRGVYLLVIRNEKREWTEKIVR